MESNEITIRVSGNNGEQALSPANFDIKHIRLLLDVVEELLFPDGKARATRPIISYEIREGSVVNVFKTSLQSMFLVSAILNAIENQDGSIDKLEPESAKAIEKIQDFAIRHNYDVGISTSDEPTRVLAITPNTHFVRHEEVMVDAEFYYYGKLIDAGGKDKANIHLQTRDHGVLTIKSDKNYLAEFIGNPLYRNFAARVRAKQNMLTGDIDRSSMVLVELVDYRPRFDRNYLQSLMERATPKWTGVDADEWVSKIREA